MTASHGVARAALRLTLFVAACTSRETGGAGGRDPRPERPIPEIRVVGTDYTFDAPDTLPAGLLRIRFTNGEGEPHHMQIVRIDSGRSIADFEASLAALTPTDPPPAWHHFVSGPGVPAPGAESVLTVRLEPGTYALVCFIESPDRRPHFARGMLHQLTVVPATDSIATPPSADVVVLMADYAWRVTPEFRAGRQTVRYEVAAGQPHEMVFVRVASGKTTQDVLRWFETLSGPLPFVFAGGVALQSPGEVSWGEVDLTPGRYVMLCLVPDARDGRPHLAHGMVREFTI